MTSGKALFPLDVLGGQPEGVDSVIREPGQENHEGNASQVRRGSGGQPTQLKELDGGRHPESLLGLLFRESSRAKRLSSYGSEIPPTSSRPRLLLAVQLRLGTRITSEALPVGSDLDVLGTQMRAARSYREQRRGCVMVGAGSYFLQEDVSLRVG
jgi:hypothetical protein